MRIEYGEENDVAYIYLADHIGKGEAVRQVVVDDDGLRGEVIIDVDRDGKVLGVEIVGATHVLRPETLATADRHDEEDPYGWPPPPAS
ncbi:DUF2283 domain-containing protein [Nonomuraea sp. FMUSA5-5]|uniref:DUF2283 domain-containing protein n=1 Tax=Nonomuraea composti TaxID=2720023 RepID=A0ABX1B8M9_9ACTN|nr:DUF2283 domain-containing protein [Nonomuraea sp. FMUSA5-5]